MEVINKKLLGKAETSNELFKNSYSCWGCSNKIHGVSTHGGENQSHAVLCYHVVQAVTGWPHLNGKGRQHFWGIVKCGYMVPCRQWLSVTEKKQYRFWQCRQFGFMQLCVALLCVKQQQLTFKWRAFKWHSWISCTEFSLRAYKFLCWL